MNLTNQAFLAVASDFFAERLALLTWWFTRARHTYHALHLLLLSLLADYSPLQILFPPPPPPPTNAVRSFLFLLFLLKVTLHTFILLYREHHVHMYIFVLLSFHILLPSPVGRAVVVVVVVSSAVAVLSL